MFIRRLSFTRDDSSGSTEYTSPQRSKKIHKREKRPETWRINIAKVNYQGGKEYVNSRGILVPAKQILPQNDCPLSWRFQCRKKLDLKSREEIKDFYYSLNQYEKYKFLLKYTVRMHIKRKTSDSDYRKFSFEFYFEKSDQKLRVCKQFFLTTLCISQRPIYNVHKNKSHTGMPSVSKRGRHKVEKITKSKKDGIRRHIESFPKVVSYCSCANGQKKYLYSTLNVNRMYKLYTGQCTENGENP